MASSTTMQQISTAKLMQVNAPTREIEPRARGKKLVKDIGTDDKLLGLGAVIMQVVELVDQEEDGAKDLCHYVLSDTALCQKILRLANSQAYRKATGTPITNVTRAITLIGFNEVRTAAMSILLLETLANNPHSHSVRFELEVSMYASLIARKVGRSDVFQASEEGAIGALLRNLGPLVVASHAHQCYDEIARLTASGEISATQAETMVLGCSYERLSISILVEWQLPEAIINSITPLPDGPCKPAITRAIWIRQVVAFSLDLGRLIARQQPTDGEEMARLLHQYGPALRMDLGSLGPIITVAKQDIEHMLVGLDIRPHAPMAPTVTGVPDLLKEMSLANAGHNEGYYPSGKPFRAHELLLSGVQQITRMSALGQNKASHIIPAILLTLCESMGFRFATLCLRDPCSNTFRARVAVGELHQQRKTGFSFPHNSANDLFHLAMENDADLMISDAGSSKIVPLLPEWHRSLLPDAASFIVLPLHIQGKSIGLFYADRIRTAPEGVPPNETSLIRALKSLALCALTNR